MVTFNIDFKTLMLGLLFLALTIFVICLIVLAIRLIKAVKEVTSVINNAKVISNMATDRAVQFNGFLSNATSSMTNIVKTTKSQKGMVNKARYVVSSARDLKQSFDEIR